MNFKKGNKIKSISFLGTLKPNEEINSRENYWVLINQEATIIDVFTNKVLVLFENELDKYGLENHNPINNSLLISKNDLINI